MEYSHNPAVIELLALLAINSPSSHEEEIASYLIHWLDNHGCTTRRDTQGNIYATVQATPGLEHEPMIMFNSHMDTVPLACNPVPIIEGAILHTDRTTALGADDKAGIAAILTALKEIQNKNIPHPPLMIVFTVSEETGLTGARNADITYLQDIAYGYTLDASGPVGTTVVRGPNKYKLTATFHGKAAHAGFSPEHGISAISMACNAVDTMNLLRIDHETTANIGSIHGGASTNVVCDAATVVMETRSLSLKKIEDQTQHMKQCCLEAAKKYGGSCEFEIDRLYFDYEISTDSPMILAIQTACKELEIPFNTKYTTGGSDANVFNRAGVPTAVLCCGYSNAHSIDEQLDLVEFDRLVRLVAALMTKE